MFAVTFTNVRSKKRQVRMAKSIGFFFDKLKIAHQLRRHCHIHVKVNNKIEGDADGWCEITEYNKQNKPREFQIEINGKLSEQLQIMTLAHEVVHVKQFLLGELNDNLTKWRGKRVPPSVSYWDQPWEIEAHGREKGLYVRLCNEELTDLDEDPFETNRSLKETPLKPKE